MYLLYNKWNNAQIILPVLNNIHPLSDLFPFFKIQIESLCQFLNKTNKVSCQFVT